MYLESQKSFSCVLETSNGQASTIEFTLDKSEAKTQGGTYLRGEHSAVSKKTKDLVFRR